MPPGDLGPGPAKAREPDAGKFYDDRGNRMSSSHASKGGRRWRYYVSRAARTGRKQDAGSIVRVPASEIENRITRAVGTHLAEVAAALAEGVPAEVMFDRMVASVPPGSQGLMLQPYWTPGIRMPGPDGRGAVIGFTDAHTRAHLYRAILEGLAYALREGGERIQAKSKVAITSLRVSGGGSQSDAAMQATADIFNLPASRPHTFETSGLGAAIVGAVGLGLHSDFPTAVAAMTRLGATFEPNPTHAMLYEELYRRIYRHMYPRLAPRPALFGDTLDFGAASAPPRLVFGTNGWWSEMDSNQRYLSPYCLRSLLNGATTTSLGLDPAARGHHRRIIAPQTAGVDV